MDPVHAATLQEAREPGEGPSATTPTASVYRPHLDGLRCVAVYLVVLFHAGIDRFSGGYIGVDVFFVLSGYLVTQVLLRDVAAIGSIRFARFYARRFRRLLPAAFVALIGTALVLVAVNPADAVASIGSFKAAFLYSANWYFIGESTSYFGDAVGSDPVLQFWSLAVEEQFYLVWPVLLAGLFWVAGRIHRPRQVLVVRVVVAAAGLASLAWALHLRVDDPDRAYFGTDARAYQLLAGASLALVPQLVVSLRRFAPILRVATPVAVVLIVVLATSVGGDDAIVRGAAVTVVTVLALIGLEVADGGIARRVLANDLVVYLGTISYGTYLWHWPVILVSAQVLDLSGRGTAVLACIAATALSALSYQVLEGPVRRSVRLDRHRLAVIGAGLTISIVSALVVVPAILEPDGSSVAAQAPRAGGFTPIPAWVDTAAIFEEGYRNPIGRPKGPSNDERACVGEDPDQCTFVRGSGAHILLMGDSHAEMMIPALTKLAEANDLTLSTTLAGGCPWQRDIYRLGKEIQDRCRRIKEDAYDRVIPALAPDVIVLVNAESVERQGPGGDQSMSAAAIEDTTRRSLDALAADGRAIVIIEPIPLAPEDLDPLDCLGTKPYLEDCRYLASAEPTAYEQLIRGVAAGDDEIRTLDLDRTVCPYLPICDPIVGDVVVKWDRQHLTSRFSEALAEPLARYLRAEGLIGG